MDWQKKGLGHERKREAPKNIGSEWGGGGPVVYFSNIKWRKFDM